MANYFNITASATSVLLNASRAGQASYSATNISGRFLRGRAALKSQNADVLKWLSLQGDVERDFAAAATQQYTIKIAVPQDTPAGNYQLSLQIIDVDDPDEHSDEGQPVTFTVAPVNAPPPTKLPWWWWIPVAAVGVIVLIVLLVVLFTPHTINIPINLDTSWQEPPNSASDYGHFQLMGISKNSGSSPAINQFNVNYDLSKLSGTSSIQKATLHLFMTSHTPANPSGLSASLGTSAWDETQSAPVPTCNFGVGSAISIPATTTTGWTEIDVTSILQKQRGGGGNFGICMTSNDATLLLVFVTHEGPAANQPYLTVTYVH